MAALEFIKQYFYDEKGNEINIKQEDEILPPAIFYPGNKFSYEGRHYQIIKTEFQKDERGKDKSTKIILREL